MVHGKAYCVLVSGAGHELLFIPVTDYTFLSPPVLMHGGLLCIVSCRLSVCLSEEGFRALGSGSKITWVKVKGHVGLGQRSHGARWQVGSHPQDCPKSNHLYHCSMLKSKKSRAV